MIFATLRNGSKWLILLIN